MLSEGSVAVATRRGRLQATAQGCCRAALEAEREGPGRGGGEEVATGMPPPPPFHSPTKTTAWIIVAGCKNTPKTATDLTQAAG